MGQKLLIVEDNDLNRTLLRDNLRYQGYEVIEAANGAEGESMARKHIPTLVLLDIQMPVMNGYATIAALRRVPAMAGVKVIAITPFAMQEERERMIEAGFDGYISKPIDVPSLNVKIREWLGEPESP